MTHRRALAPRSRDAVRLSALSQSRPRVLVHGRLRKRGHRAIRVDPHRDRVVGLLVTQAPPRRRCRGKLGCGSDDTGLTTLDRFANLNQGYALATLSIEVLRLEPGFESGANQRPLTVHDREPH